MTEFLTLMLVSAVAFASTSIDSLAVLIPLLGDRRQHAQRILSGYALGVTGVVTASWALGILGEWLRPQWVGLLGLVPISIGAVGLWHLAFGDSSVREPRVIGNGVVGVALLTGSLSGDNLAVLVPLFAESSRAQDAAVLAGCALAACVWATLALRLSRVAAISRAIEVWGARLVPFLLMAIGVYVLLDTATDRL